MRSNLRPLLNPEILKTRQMDQFENRICHILRIPWNILYFQTDSEKIPLAPPPAAPPGRCLALGRGIFSESV